MSRRPSDWNEMELIEITTATTEQLLKIAKDRVLCRGCKSCSVAYISNKGKDLGGSCNEAKRVIAKPIEDLFDRIIIESEHNPQPTVDIPQQEDKPSESSFYDSTKNFMKSSGYTHCYMCGSKLK